MAATKRTNKTSKTSAPRLKSKLKTGDYIRAAFFFALSLVGLAVSLPHLASEVNELTSSGLLSSWLVAIIFDMGMIASKVNISANGPSKRACWGILISCTMVSMVFNSHAFLSHSDTVFGCVMAVAMGIFIPLFILTLSYVGSKILLKHKD